MGQDVSEKEKQQIDSHCIWPSWSSIGWNTCFSTRVKVENSGQEIPNHDAESEKQNCTKPPSEQTIECVTNNVDKQEELLSSSQLRRFAFNDLKVATRNFRPDSLLGRGGFGSVFKGWVDEHGTAPVKPGTGLTVAVKILNQGGLQGHREWLAEITYLGQLYHPHLVKLIGYCMEDDQRLLVYEFMKRGSLENHLFRKNANPLPWSIRMKAALGAAKGLEFLHSENKSAKDGKRSVIYRDFKTSNILLDSEYNAKLSDFGLAKDGPQDDKTHVSTRVMGTYGYAAPEYVMTGHLNYKSDIYSFGVVLLEILTGLRSMDNSRPSGQHNLVEWARHYLNDKKRILKIIDQRLDGRYCIQGAQKAGDLARRCLNRDPKARPSMTEVVGILEQIQNIKEPANTAPMPPSKGNMRHP